ncbi:MAG: hypothetical protein ACFFB0_19625 [Promethearchaeota archaeon]
MKKKDNDYNQGKKNENDTNGYLEDNSNQNILETNNDLDEKDSSFLDTNNLFNDVFKELQNEQTKSNSISHKSTVYHKLGDNNLNKNTNTLNTEFYNNDESIAQKNDNISYDLINKSKIQKSKESTESSLNYDKNNIKGNLEGKFFQENEIETIYKRKNKELEEKIGEYNEKYHNLEEKIEEYEEKTSELIKKRKEFDDSIKEYEEKSKLLDERNEEISIQMGKLKEAREKIVELSKQIEEKKIDLEDRGENLKKSERNLEKIKFELERSRLEFEENKLEFELGKSNLETTKKVSESPDAIKKIIESGQVADGVKEAKSGKGEILQNLMLNLLHTGNFKSCFLIDGKGMLISEYSNVQLDSIAIGAMFSLICTTVLRAVKTLNLYELEFFKVSSTSGEFIMKNINIMNYERNFILLAYYDNSNSTIREFKQILNKKTIKRILKNVKKDFYELDNDSKSSGIFENLNDRLNFLKKKYSIPKEELELRRVELLNQTSIKIKDLFEK